MKKWLYAFLLLLTASPALAQIGSPGISNPPATVTAGLPPALAAGATINGTAETILFRLDGDSAATQTFLSFTNIADPGRIVLMETNTTTPILTFKVMDDTVAVAEFGELNVREDQVVMQSSDADGNTASFNVGNEDAIFSLVRNALGTREIEVDHQDSEWGVRSNASLNSNWFLRLHDAAASTFLRFENVATPTNVITLDQDTSVPSLTTTVTDGTRTATHSLDGSASVGQSTVVSDGTGDASVVLSVPGATGLVEIAGSDGLNQSVARVSPRGLAQPYIAAVASAATITPFSNVFHVTGTTNIDTITTTTAGTCYTLIFDDVLTVGDLTGNINLSAAFVSTANDTLSLCHDGTTWFETGRSVN